MAAGVPAFSILVPHLRLHLQKAGISFKSRLLDNLTEIFAGNSRSSIPQVFLAVGSTLRQIPKGRNSREKSESTVYQRCIQIKKAAMSDDTVTSLEAGKMYKTPRPSLYNNSQ